MSGTGNIAYVCDAADNVATLPWGGNAGAQIALRGTGSAEQVSVVLTADIPPGHKCALRKITPNGAVVKYGLPIGTAREELMPGDHVHVRHVVSRLSPDEGSGVTCSGPVTVIAHDDLVRVITGALVAAGASDEAACNTAEHCAAAELSGVGTHGIRRVPALVERLQSGGIDGAAHPEVDRNDAVLCVDGGNGLGHHVARVAADAALEAAQQLGVAVALVRNSNHFGYAGYYAGQIARAGLLGIAVSNGQVLVGPPGARQAIFSNNPIALATPLDDDGIFEFDMATSVTSRAKIAQAAERGEAIAPGIALDAEGRPTQDASAALTGILLPLGGAKGFGLIAALEVLTGILPGGAYADQVSSKESAPGSPEGTSHFLMAISPEACGGTDRFRERMQDLAHRVAALDMAPGSPAARLPGARRAALRKDRLANGIPLDARARDILSDLTGGGEAQLKLKETYAR